LSANFSAGDLYYYSTTFSGGLAVYVIGVSKFTASYTLHIAALAITMRVSRGVGMEGKLVGQARVTTGKDLMDT
jgi:hypothetical protein